MIGAGNGEEAAPESPLPVDGRRGGGVVGCVGTSTFAAIFGKACISLRAAGTSARACCCLGMFMAVKDDTNRAVTAAKGGALEAVMNTCNRTQTEIDPQSNCDYVDPKRGIVVSLGAPAKQSGAMGKGGRTNDGVINDKRRIRESDNKAEARGRTLGKKRTVRCTTDSVAPRVDRHKIGTAVKFRNAVG